MKEYPQYDQDIILKAVSNYHNRCSLNGFKFMKLAVNYIIKDKESMLASECEAILEGNSNSTPNFSSGIWVLLKVKR